MKKKLINTKGSFCQVMGLAATSGRMKLSISITVFLPIHATGCMDCRKQLSQIRKETK